MDIKVLIFDLSGLSCALPIEDIQKIVPMARLSSPPSLPPILKGFLNLAGTAIPVLHLARLFRLQEKPAGIYSHILIIKHHHGTFGILVDYASRMLMLAEESLLPLEANGSLKHCAKAQTTIDGETIYFLSAESLLLQEERQCIEELQTMEQQRIRDLEVRGSVA